MDFRRAETGEALLNTNLQGLQAYRAQRKSTRDLEETINNINANISDMKRMLAQILSEVTR